MISVEVLLASGTQWSHKPIDRLPAAFAVRTKGALIIAADDSAVAATNCRRVSLFRDMACLSLIGQSDCSEIPLVFGFISQPKPTARGFRCLRSDQNCRLLSRNQV